MNLRTAFTAFLMLLALQAAPQFVALTDTVDFGMIREAEGPKTMRLYLKNISDSRQSLLKVRPSCGCTAADFYKEAVAPGDSAWIDLTYRPHRRPGRFEKDVRIYPAEGKMFRVAVAGTVMASKETVENPDEAVETEVYPIPLPPGEKGVIGIYINPLKEKREGDVEYKVGVASGLTEQEAENGRNKIELTVKAEIQTP